MKSLFLRVVEVATVLCLVTACRDRRENAEPQSATQLASGMQHSPGVTPNVTSATQAILNRVSSAADDGLSHRQTSKDLESSQSKFEVLRKTPMEQVTPNDGFAYFSGWLTGDGDYGTDLPTLYLHYSDFGPQQGWQLKVIAPGINLDFRGAELDDALRMYRLIAVRKISEPSLTFEQMMKILDALEKELGPSITTNRRDLSWEEFSRRLNSIPTNVAPQR